MLEVEELHAGYASARVLRGVSLAAREGEVVALLGRNGMGKTTLLRTICGLRPPVATSGRVRLAGRDLLGLAPHRVARQGISLVPQGRRVFGSLTVQENLAVAARKADRGWDVRAVYDLFPRLRERQRQHAGTLSGGEQQMLAIGRSLMTNPRLLVMDEPSEGLAPSMIDIVGDGLQEVRRRGHTVLIAEQNVDLALSVADRVVVLGETGRVTWTGEPAALRDNAELVRQLVGL